MIKTKSSLVLFAVLAALNGFAGSFEGTRILEILGENKASGNVEKFRNEFLLDKSLKNSENGIKLTFNREEPLVVTGLLLASAGYQINDLVYKSFKGDLPFNITWNDNDETLREKLGLPKTTSEDKSKYKKDGITINIFFKNNLHKKIAYIKFSQNIGTTSPYRLDGNHEEILVEIPAPVVAAPVDKTKDVVVNGKGAAIKTARAAALPGPAQFTKTSTTAGLHPKSPLYNAIINVFESGEDEMFKDIKGTTFGQNNFWNYKYTYAAKVNIPGAKYSMLYSYPFATSQLDFVSVLEEADGPTASNIQAKYIEIEGKLKEDFKLTEGWTYNYIINRDNPKGPRDFELKNPKLGSIVLDHSVNPYGRQVLYLRFLLQYD